jgi:16S rRNA (cytidine1402-2'-O)-methyltransferase
MSELFIVSTPIGNLKDISGRAITVLRSVTLVLAEDTRVTIKLLNHYDIKVKLVSYHKFSERMRTRQFIYKMLNEDISVALVTDAGTPCISDPGAVLVNECLNNNIDVHSIPGASAVTAVLAISGFSFDSFLFLGFLPIDNKKKELLIQDAQKVELLVIYESPKRIAATVKYLDSVFDNTEFFICRDVTKKFETRYRGFASEALSQLADDKNHERGEYTVVIRKDKSIDNNENSISAEALILNEMIKGSKTLREAYNYLLIEKTLSRNILYDAMLNLKQYLREEEEQEV